MISVRLDEQLEAELNRLARLTNRLKSFFDDDRIVVEIIKVGHRQSIYR